MPLLVISLSHNNSSHICIFLGKTCVLKVQDKKNFVEYQCKEQCIQLF